MDRIAKIIIILIPTLTAFVFSIPVWVSAIVGQDSYIVTMTSAFGKLEQWMDVVTLAIVQVVGIYLAIRLSKSNKI